MENDFIIICCGIIISFLSGVFATVNIASSINHRSRSILSIIYGHLGSMIGMSFGGVITVIGIVMAIFDFANQVK